MHPCAAGKKTDLQSSTHDKVWIGDVYLKKLVAKTASAILLQSLTLPLTTRVYSAVEKGLKA